MEVRKSMDLNDIHGIYWYQMCGMQQHRRKFRALKLLYWWKKKRLEIMGLIFQLRKLRKEQQNNLKKCTCKNKSRNQQTRK